MICNIKSIVRMCVLELEHVLREKANWGHSENNLPCIPTSTHRCTMQKKFLLIYKMCEFPNCNS